MPYRTSLESMLDHQLITEVWLGTLRWELAGQRREALRIRRGSSPRGERLDATVGTSNELGAYAPAPGPQAIEPQGGRTGSTGSTTRGSPAFVPFAESRGLPALGD